MGQKLLKELYGIEAKVFRNLGDKAFSIMGRHVACVEETWLISVVIERWLKEVRPGAETYVKTEVPDAGEGTGFTEAPRGSLLHYLKIKDQKIENYQVVSATLWNCSPMDDMNQRGPVEQALLGIPVPDVKNPVNVGRLVRAYDPRLGCTEIGRAHV